jgi:hypothetical protein
VALADEALQPHPRVLAGLVEASRGVAEPVVGGPAPRRNRFRSSTISSGHSRSRDRSDEISHTALMDRLRARIKDKRISALVKAFLKSGVLTELGDREETLTGTPQGGLCSAEHNDPYAQCRVMRSAGLPGLVGAGSASEHCA